jgi:RNA polymerase sigma factor (sigma-70 family)
MMLLKQKICLSNKDIEKYDNTVRAAVNKLLLSRHFFYLYVQREDLYQIAWIALINCIKTFDANRNVKFETYASKAIINVINKEFKKLLSHKYLQVPDDVLVIDVPEYKDAYMKKLVSLIEKNNNFSERERKIFWLHFTEEKSFSEISKLFVISRQRVQQIYNKSIRRLKELVKNV